MIPEPAFSIGIEEEYFLIDLATRDLAVKPPAGLFKEFKKQLGKRVTTELLQCQVEVGTPVCKTIKQARAELAAMRRTVAEVAQKFDLGMVAVSIHPFAEHDDLLVTRKKRYQGLRDDLQQVGRRLMIVGMHVHAGIEDADLRVDLMGQVSYVLPHFLALSTSSPFWQGEDTGMKSYRVAVWNELPRTGLPEHFDTFAEYRRHANILVDAGIIEDSTKIWWDLRPSDRYPTLEMRIADICTLLDDGICIAALYMCWLRMLWRLRNANQRWRKYANFLIEENRWRAQRYGLDGGLLDFGRGEIVPCAELLEEMITMTHDDAHELDCVEEVEHGRHIITDGSSAHRQIAVYKEARAAGDSHEEALHKVVDFLREETLRGC